MDASIVHSKAAFEALRTLTRQGQPLERCELCAAALSDRHSHLYEPHEGRLLCACTACTLLFYRRAGETKYLRVPDSARRLNNFQISDAEWSALMLPIDLAFFQNSTRAGRVVAYYPSPAGCTESLLNLDAWRDIVEKNPELEQMLSDVETLLVNRTRQRRDYYIAPIDQCYKLAGLVRTHWHGLSGGELVWQKIDEFFKSLDGPHA